MKYYIIAGELSGDLHGSNLIAKIKKYDKDAQFRAWGGDMMKNQGATIVKHIKELAFMGFIEVARNLRTILNNIRFCQKDILNFQPDVVIFIDYPGFNLKISRFAKKHFFRTVYYISPQIWAWNQSRVKTIKQCIDKMLVILPFEKDFYARHNYDVTFVGHPLLDSIGQNSIQPNEVEFRNKNNLGPKPIIALLPGSRAQEISRMLKTMTSVVAKFPDYQFVIAGVTSHNEAFYQRFLENSASKLVFEQTYDLLRNSKAAIVASGTATLETALLGTPQVVCYKGSMISYLIAKILIKIKFISLVNLIMDKKVVPELIQYNFNPQKLSVELHKVLNDQTFRENIKTAYSSLREKLGGQGASEKAATEIFNFLN